MPHRDHGTACNDVVELLAQNGFDGMAQAIEILMNEAMKFERGNVLRAASCKRTEERRCKHQSEILVFFSSFFALIQMQL